MRVSNEGSQTNLATCDPFPVATMAFIYVSYSSIVGATYRLKICSNPVQDKSLLFSSAWKRKKIEDWEKLQKLEIS